MPAVVNIKPTRNITRAVNYASAHNGKDKAHNGYDMKRVLCASGVNCDPKNGLKEMMKLINRKQFIQDLKPQKKKIVQGYTLIQSFDKSFDHKNEADVQKVNELGQKLVEKVIKNRMALVYTQADGTHHMLHNHIIVCSLASNLKAMRAKQTRFKTWAKANDEVLREAGLETLAPVSKGKTIAKEKLTRAEIAEMDKLSKNKDKQGNPAPKRTRMEEIKEKIEEIEQDPNVIDFDSFVEVAKKYDLDVHVRRNKKKVINGLSYKLLNTSMKRGIRARRLGSNYMKESLNDVFEANGKRKRLAKQREERISAGTGNSTNSEITEANRAGNVQATNIQFTEQGTTGFVRAKREIASRTVRRSINRDLRQGFETSNRQSQKDNNFDFFQFTRRFGNNERKHKRFDEALKQFVDYRRKLDEIRAEQLKQQQQANTVALLSRVELDRQLAKAAEYKQTNSKRIEKQQKLVTRFGYTLKPEYSDYADLLTNQDIADVRHDLHPEWFVKDQPEQQNPETPTQTQKQQNQNIDDDGWHL